MTAISTENPVKETPESAGFRWRYVALPAAAFIVAIIIAGVFYGRLPPDTAYRFSDGEPVSWLGRGGVLAWALGLQLILLLLSIAITALVTGASRRMQLAETPLTRMLYTIVGNVAALPQLIIAYAMLDIFLYNIYGSSLPPLWAFAIAVMLAGGVVLAVLFTRAFAQAGKLKNKNQSGSESDAR